MSNNRIRKPYAGTGAIMDAAAAAADAAAARGDEKKPLGWYSREQREARVAAREARREVADRERASTTARQAQLEPLRAGAAKRLASLPPRQQTGTDRSVTAAALRAESVGRQAAITKRFAPWEGTPETQARIAAVPEHRRQRPLARMSRMGKITAEELVASDEIADVAEMIGRAVGMSSGSLEARVDCNASARDALIESLGRIRAEVAYRAWCEAVPEPRQMIYAMILTNASFVKLASIYGLHWRTARKRLVTALRLWPTMKLQARRDVDEGTVADVYARLGAGVLLAPKLKSEMATIADDAAR